MALFETISRLYKDNESYQQHVQNALFMSHRPGVSDYGSHCLSVSTSSWPPVALVSHSSVAEGTLYLNVREEQLCSNPLALWLAD